MKNTKELQQQVMMAARDQGVSSVLFRNATARRLGLNVTDSDCLTFLSTKGGTATPTEVARYTGLTTGSTTAMLDRLEKAGFITRKPNPTDRRGVFIEIAKHWQETAGPLMADIVKAHQQLIASYSDKDLAVIIDFLHRFTQNVAEQTTKLTENQ